MTSHGQEGQRRQQVCGSWREAQSPAFLPAPGGSSPAPRGLERRPQPPEPGALRMGGNTLRGYAPEDDASTRVCEKHGRHAGHVHSSCRSLFTNFIKRGRKDSFVEPLVSLILGGGSHQQFARADLWSSIPNPRSQRKSVGGLSTKLRGRGLAPRAPRPPPKD